MVRRKHVQRSVFEVLLPDAAKLWDPVLRRVDEILEDEEVVDLVADALGRRRPGSRRKGRPGTPVEVVLRMLVLKHLYDWSFDECEREVRGSLVYRAFCRIGCERAPDAKTLIRLSHSLDADVLKKVLARLVDLARERKVVRGWKLRVDTTVVETNVHYPTDSSLLSDGVTVLTRTLKKLKEKCRPPGQSGYVASPLADARTHVLWMTRHGKDLCATNSRADRSQPGDVAKLDAHTGNLLCNTMVGADPSEVLATPNGRAG